MMQWRLVLLVAAHFVASKDEPCHHFGYYTPCNFSLFVPKHEWLEGSLVSGINCTSACTETEPSGARYTLKMLLNDKPIKQNDSESRFELECFEHFPIDGPWPSAAVRPACFLVVKNASREDAGLLACNLHRGDIHIGGKRCDIKILSKPLPSDLTLMQTPGDGAVIDGSSFSMTCDVNAGVQKPPMIQWMHNETRVVKEERGLSSTYHVAFLNETNGGRYGCWVQNEEGSASKNLPNLFEAAVRPEISEFSASVNGYNETTRDVVVAWKGHIIDFVCRGNGNPVPTVTVTHGNESSFSQLAGGGSATGKFIVTNSSSVDDGTYVCHAENKVDSVYANITLIVCEAPPSISSFDVSPKLDSTSQCVPVDGGFSLKCFAHGFPSPSIELVSPASTRGFVAHEGEAVYKITNDSPNGMYVCRVENACGNASEVYHLCTTPTTNFWFIFIAFLVAALIIGVVVIGKVSATRRSNVHSLRNDILERRNAASQNTPLLPDPNPRSSYYANDSDRNSTTIIDNQDSETRSTLPIIPDDYPAVPSDVHYDPPNGQQLSESHV